MDYNNQDTGECCHCLKCYPVDAGYFDENENFYCPSCWDEICARSEAAMESSIEMDKF